MKSRIYRAKQNPKRNNLVLLGLLALLSLAPVFGQSYPPNTTLQSQATPFLNRPSYLAPINDPSFNTNVVRISDQDAFSAPDKLDLRHAYSRVSAWNSDGTKIALSGTYPTPILNGNTYALIYKASTIPTNARWSNTNPNIMYGIEYGTNKFETWNVNTQVKIVLRDFTQYDPGTLSIGNGEGSTSNDDRYVVFHAKSGAANYIIVFDILNNVIVSALNTGTVEANNATISQLGNHVVIQWGANGYNFMQGIDVYNKNLVFQRKIHTNGFAHFDAGIDTAGNEVIAYQKNTETNSTKRKPYMFRLDTIQETDLLGATAIEMAPDYHVSCRNIARPGWAYYSSFDGSDSISLPGRDQVWAVKLDGSGTVQVFAHAHHLSAGDYSSEAQAVPNHTGDKVIFSSEWNGDSVNGPIYAYAARMIGAPAAPSGLTAATVSNSQINLTWVNNANNQTGFEVDRAFNSTFSSGLVVNAYTIGANPAMPVPAIGLTAGVTYYFRARATNASGDSANSNTAHATTPLPPPWQSQDIGSVSPAGSVSHASATFTVNGSGGVIWGTADGFRYVYQIATGDCAIVARVVTQQNTSPFAKTGVMIRETLATGSKHAMMNLTPGTPGNGPWFTYRNSTGGASASIDGGSGAAPYWVRIVRTGNIFTGSTSSNGVTWVTGGAISITMGANVYIGLANNSNLAGTLNTSTFSNVATLP